jgi:transglutaminase-like putative cysteine protease
VSHELRIEPATDERREERDAFGNGVTHFAVYGPHPLLRVRMISQVEIGERPDPAAAEPIAWEAVRDAVRGEPAAGRPRPGAAQRAERARALVGSGARLCRAELRPGRDWLEAIVHLRRRIHADFEFEPGATTVSTQVDEVLEQRSGVCQDFAHVMLACLRGQGLPARYVSGYLRTDPPPGGRGCSASTPRMPGSRRIRRTTAGSSSIRPTTPAPTSATSPSPGAPTSPTSCRCAA